ncbi:MAG: acyltransferase, partial [Candidatus Thorarchaeota archaeon]
MKINKSKSIISENDDEDNLEFFFRTITSLQAITIILIIIWHIGDLSSIRFSPNIFIRTFFEIIESSGDVFIFLSGMLLAFWVTRNNKDRSWKKWYGRRVVRIYPLLIISVPLYLVSNYFLFSEIYSINSILIHMSGLQSIPTNPNFFLIAPPHWYITLLLSCYLLFPLLYFLIKKNIKLVAFGGLLLYICYLLFANNIYELSKNLVNLVFQKELILWYFSLFILRYFVFFFGMLLGFWLGKDTTRKINFLQKKSVGLIAFLTLMLIVLCYFIFPITDTTFLDFIRILYHPIITINIVIFSIWFFKNRRKTNKVLEVPGNATLELFLFHQLIVDNIYYRIIVRFSLQDRIELYLLFIPLIVIISVALSFPFYLLGNFFKKEKKLHK